MDVHGLVKPNPTPRTLDGWPIHEGEEGEPLHWSGVSMGSAARSSTSLSSCDAHSRKGRENNVQERFNWNSRSFHAYIVIL